MLCVLMFSVLIMCHVNVSFDQSKLSSSSSLVLKILTFMVLIKSGILSLKGGKKKVLFTYPIT